MYPSGHSDFGSIKFASCCKFLDFIVHISHICQTTSHTTCTYPAFQFSQTPFHPRKTWSRES